MNLKVKPSMGALALRFGAQNGLASAVNPTGMALPRGTVQLSPCIPGMGKHWARPKDFPSGPVYGVQTVSSSSPKL
ncbi:MAG: hypothetical protein M3Z14_00370 [Candidatus Eremiobacteraeota bacterium]|nr:hypothetical protein [Candidatus Eremiobacteraeota bacterium]